MNSNKSQVAIEFLILIVFGLVVVSLIIYGISLYIVDLNQQQNQQQIDDVAQSILDEFETAGDTQNGFSRTVTLDPHLINRYNISLNASSGYLILQDLYGTDPSRKYYYVIEGVENFTYSINSSNSAHINLTGPPSQKNTQSQLNIN